ncbi:MAG: diphthine synthase [Ferroplasma sp.]
MLNILGIGLRGVRSITLEQLDILKSSDSIYFESYTSISPENTLDSISALVGKHIKNADRNLIEQNRTILNDAKNKNVSLIVTGDALSATTHNEIRLEAINMGIRVNSYENASIITTFPSKAGLFNYKFGNIISLPFICENFFPLSVYDKIYKNYINEMHTLLLLDLKDGKTMTPEEAAEILLKMEKKRNKKLITAETRVIAGTCISGKDEKLIYTSIGGILSRHLSGSPSALILPASINSKEEEFLNIFCED